MVRFRFWHEEPPAPLTTLTTTTNTPTEFQEDINRTQARLDEIRAQLDTLNIQTNWTINQTRDYVDATVFGETNRTYLVGGINPTQTFEDWHTFGDGPHEDYVRRSRVLAEALAKSAELLQRYITPKEWTGLQKPDGKLRVRGKHITYEIDRFATVYTVKPQKGQFCIYPIDHNLPHWDKVLTQKLWIEHREEEFIAEANWQGMASGHNLMKIDIEGKVLPGSEYPGARAAAVRLMHTEKGVYMA